MSDMDILREVSSRYGENGTLLASHREHAQWLRP